jgi:BirA family biotin operon repressor/biotin-[acetyl-CoA-carboxylase] ligase
MAASLAVRPSGWRTAEFARLSLLSALAGQAVLGEGITCKWPNDLLAGSNKVAGLLLEARGDLVVIGLGVNLWWPDPPAGYGSLLMSDPGPEAGVDLAVRWCDDLLVRVERGPQRWGREDYVKVCRTMGREIRWLPEGSGVVRDIDEEGRLVVETESGMVRLSSGEVWEIR